MTAAAGGGDEFVGGEIGMDSLDGVMDAVERERSEIRVEDRKKRETLMEERKTKKEKEETKQRRAARWKEFLAREAEFLAEELESEVSSDTEPEEPWASYRDWWNRVWGEDGYFGTFEDNTSIQPMRLTYSDYEIGHAMETLMFFSIKLSVDASLELPLDVHGFVAVRDIVDHKRNMIFCCDRDNCLTITKQDQYLELTGPTRAVVVTSDPSYFEAKLKVKGATESDDKVLSLVASEYRSGFLKRRFTSKLSTLEMNFHEIASSVEATISVKVIQGSWPDGFRGVFGASIDSIAGLEVKLLESVDDKLHVDADGKIKLRRSVVSVELEGKLSVSVTAYRGKEGVVDSGKADFTPKSFDTSTGFIDLKVGSCRMEVTVGWSLFCFHP